MTPIKNMMAAIKNAQNPQAMMMQMMQSNPQYSKVMNIIQQNGGDAQKAFYSIAGQLGVDGNEIINMLK